MKLLPPPGTLKPNDEHDPLPYYYRPLVGWLYRKRLRMGLDLLARQGTRVLEVGVGSGILVPTLSAHFSRYTGTDLVLADGLIASSRPPAKPSSCRPISCANRVCRRRAYDAVICLSVLEHIADAEGAASALARTLVKGGTLVAGYPMVNRTDGWTLPRHRFW
jgi:2-polyprenyl-3-methyl-5-hydroxy-6-metoxy-1,4-benzoquinol methylase